jgi:hypothetical protein
LAAESTVAAAFDTVLSTAFTASSAGAVVSELLQAENMPAIAITASSFFMVRNFLIF